MNPSLNNNASQLVIEHGIATISLNQPEKHNAFDDLVIAELIRHLDTIKQQKQVRVVVLRAEGKHFCAGADLAWMKRMAKLDYQQNLDDAKNLALLMEKLNALPQPTIARIQGAAYGGAIGLIACCDIALASDNARFCLSEVKLGLAPATIGPYVIAAMGARRCRQLFLTAEVFSAQQASEYQLVHRVVALDQLDEHVSQTITQICQAGPKAAIAAKQLIQDLSAAPENVSDMTSALIAELRVSEEGQEGLSAFFDKRLPSWRSS